jgi:ribosome-binding protein aMBF1 (putative translation factor)
MPKHAAKLLLEDKVEVRPQPAAERLVGQRRQERKSFIEALEQPALKAELASNEVFSTLVALAVYDYGVPQKELAEVLDIDPSGITRWAKGETAPRQYARPLVVSGIIGVMQKQLAQSEKD